MTTKHIVRALRDGFREWEASTKRFDRMLAALPDRAWLE